METTEAFFVCFLLCFASILLFLSVTLLPLFLVHMVEKHDYRESSKFTCC